MTTNLKILFNELLLLMEATQLIAQDIKDAGEVCDHDADICLCYHKNLLEQMDGLVKSKRKGFEFEMKLFFEKKYLMVD